MCGVKLVDRLSSAGILEWVGADDDLEKFVRSRWEMVIGVRRAFFGNWK